MNQTNHSTMNSIKKIGLIIFFCGSFGSIKCMAQIPPPPTPTTPPTQVPIDGGIVLLAAAGAAYGARKIYKKNKN